MHTYIVTCAYRYTYAHIFILVYVCQLVIQLARCVRTYRHAYLNAYTYVYTQLVFASNHRPPAVSIWDCLGSLLLPMPSHGSVSWQHTMGCHRLTVATGSHCCLTLLYDSICAYVCVYDAYSTYVTRCQRAPPPIHVVSVLGVRIGLALVRRRLRPGSSPVSAQARPDVQRRSQHAANTSVAADGRNLAPPADGPNTYEFIGFWAN